MISHQVFLRSLINEKLRFLPLIVPCHVYALSGNFIILLLRLVNISEKTGAARMQLCRLKYYAFSLGLPKLLFNLSLCEVHIVEG